MVLNLKLTNEITVDERLQVRHRSAKWVYLPRPNRAPDRGGGSKSSIMHHSSFTVTFQIQITVYCLVRLALILFRFTVPQQEVRKQRAAAFDELLQHP
jgi:hypothetical protein